MLCCSTQRNINFKWIVSGIISSSSILFEWFITFCALLASLRWRIFSRVLWNLTYLLYFSLFSCIKFSMDLSSNVILRLSSWDFFCSPNLPILANGTTNNKSSYSVLGIFQNYTKNTCLVFLIDFSIVSHRYKWLNIAQQEAWNGTGLSIFVLKF